jgi:GNAT superfamily N-acetyltransferase
MSIDIVYAYTHKHDVQDLLSEYGAFLLERNPSFGKSLTLQDYDHEVENLENKYGMPDARFYLLLVDGTTAGCIAFHRFDGQRCELKRMYVRPQFRGRKLASKLLQRALDDARAAGYQAVLLDTMPVLGEALQLYRKNGFYDIPAYYDTPVKATIFMCKAL